MKGLPAGLHSMMLGSVALHALVLGLFMVASTFNARFAAPPQAVMVTKLVRLGEVRPKDLLPRMDEPAPPPPSPVVAPAPAPVPVAPATPSPTAMAPLPVPKAAEKRPVSARDRINAMSRVSKALDHLKQKVEGTSDGSVEGEVSEAALAMIGNRYGTEVEHCLRRNYAFEGIDPAKVAGLKAVIIVLIQADGKITGHRIEQSSGSSIVDQAVERAVVRCGKVSPPPPEIRDLVRAGIEVEFNASAQ